jgi:acid phosphatase
MRNLISARLVLACTVCFVAGWLWGGGRPTNLLADRPPPATTDAVAFPMSARLGGNLYLQTAAEYRACCRGIYKCAELRLETLLQHADPKPARPAVVMDLDETVLDNSAFQTYLYQNGLEYTPELWADYEDKAPQDVTLIPGARQFIDRAEALGVTVIYISNRSELHQKATETALETNGIDATKPAGRLYLKPKGATNDKSARREAVAAKYNVVMYFGDNLRDFSEAFKAAELPKDATPEDCLKAIRRRAATADDAVCHWGVDWFVLPNPVYGEWDRLLGSDPKALLHPTSMKGKARLPR